MDREAQDYNIRLIREHEIETVFQLIHQEGWNLTKLKFSLLCKTHPESVYVMVTPDDIIAATVSYYLISEQEFYISNMVVGERYRKKGLGSKLIKTTLSLLPHTVVQLTAMPGTEAFYTRLEFQPCQDDSTHEVFYLEVDADQVNHRVEQLVNNTGCAEQGVKELTNQRRNNKELNGDMSEGVLITPFEDQFFKKLVDYDNNIRGYENTVFISLMLKCNNVLVALSGKKDSKIVGFVSSYLKGEEIVFDGLFADLDATAALLFQKVLRNCEGRKRVQLQTFPSNHFLLQFGTIKDSCEFKRFSSGGEPSILPPVQSYNLTEYD